MSAGEKLERVYLLSPAHCGGKRAQMLLREGAAFDLAVRLRGKGAPLGEVFAFMSGLYFRGKMAYVEAFAGPKSGAEAWVITPNRGLLAPDMNFKAEELRGLAATDIQHEDLAYRTPLVESAQRVAARLGKRGQAILLGSIATDKYVQVLAEVFGERLCFPEEFVGRGDMSRGGLMLRCAREGTPLTYIPLAGAARRGGRARKISEM